jgi:hypothetical protein
VGLTTKRESCTKTPPKILDCAIKCLVNIINDFGQQISFIIDQQKQPLNSQFLQKLSFYNQLKQQG